MNDCKVIGERLSAYIDGELRPQERILIEKHLHQCSACAQEESSLRKITDLLNAIPDETPFPYFTSRAVHRVVSWTRCEYVKEHLYRPSVAYALSVISLAIHNASIKRRYPSYGYLRTFDDLPPESLSSIYVTLIQGESR